MERMMVGAAIGDCVHVAGLLNFFRLAEIEGYRTEFLGAGVPVEKLVGAAKETNAPILAVSYRLDPSAATALFRLLERELAAQGLGGKTLLFGGTPPVAQVAVASGLFHKVFSGGEDLDEIIAFLRGGDMERPKVRYASTLLERMEQKAPYPLLRHHFGLPSLSATLEGIAAIAEAEVLDVISIGPDQNAQEHFFKPEQMDPWQDGAGGVPLRQREDFLALDAARQRGNFPLLRCYSGTTHLLDMAQLLRETIGNAWAAVPLFWYNEMDGRSERSLADAIRENQAIMAWHGVQGIPVEVNEAHHWSLRDAHDVIAVATAFLAAYNARQAGVGHYVAQFMFNTPPTTSPVMDLAKMLAKLDLIQELAGDDFAVYRQVRAGLSSFPADLDVAKGHLAASLQTALLLRPNLVHVVGYCEAVHIAGPEEIISSCKIARGVLRHSLGGLYAVEADSQLTARRQELVTEARYLLEHIRQVGQDWSADPWTDPQVLEQAVRAGLLDAPHLRSNVVARGWLRTTMLDGACRAVHPDTQKPWSEAERIVALLPA